MLPIDSMRPLSTAGHRGDLPVLVVDNRGDATEAVTAPHLTVAEIRGRSIGSRLVLGVCALFVSPRRLAIL